MLVQPNIRGACRRDLTTLLATAVVYLSPVLLLVAVRVVAQTHVAAPAHTTRQELPLTKFYDTPKPLPAGRAGELIRSEPFEDYYLPMDFSAFRILYHSRSASGQDVVSSGVVLVPEGTPPRQGWPVIAWAHGFTGAARQCAPSLLRNLYYGPFLSMYLNLGYAVVAADYTGLGTDSRSAVLDVPSDSTDVIDSIPAAHSAVPQLGARWVAMGPSMGGNVAIGVAEMENNLHDPDFLGSIAISGIADMKEASERWTSEKSFGMLEFMAYTIKSMYPGFSVDDMLMEKALPSYNKIGETCGSLDNDHGLSVENMLKEHWQSNQFVEKFLDRNALGQKAARSPLLVISGDGDSEGMPAMTGETVARMCRQGDRVQLDKFSESQSGMVLGDSVRDQMAWIEARFAGRAAASNCP